jgi:peptidoglycan L-alanyl-D-glutamate endopeptidase CwlK
MSKGEETLSSKVELLHPDLQPKTQQLIDLCKAHGITIQISQTLRSKAEQDAIYAQGRTAPGKIVTNAPYPQSLHCWGLAFDIVVLIDGKANWDTAYYLKVGPLGESLGLEWGGNWTSLKDYPHYQLKGYSWSALQKQYGTPEKFIASWKEAVPVAEVPQWKIDVIKKGEQLKLISPNIHKPDEPADKAFVVAVAINLMTTLKDEK